MVWKIRNGIWGRGDTVEYKIGAYEKIGRFGSHSRDGTLGGVAGVSGAGPIRNPTHNMARHMSYAGAMRAVKT